MPCSCAFLHTPQRSCLQRRQQHKKKKKTPARGGKRRRKVNTCIYHAHIHTACCSRPPFPLMHQHLSTKQHTPPNGHRRSSMRPRLVPRTCGLHDLHRQTHTSTHTHAHTHTEAMTSVTSIRAGVTRLQRCFGQGPKPNTHTHTHKQNTCADATTETAAAAPHLAA